MPPGYIDRAKVEAADINFRAAFQGAFERAPTMYEKLAMVIESNHRSELLSWPGAAPKLKEWIGDAQFQKIRAYAQTITHKKFQMGLEVDADDIEDDQLGLVKPAIEDLAEQAKQLPDDLIIDLLVNGFTGAKGLAYDGQYFFDTDHKDGTGAVQSNKGTAALTSTSFNAAMTSMMTRLDDQGSPLRIRPTHLLVPPQLRETALNLLEAEYLANGATNINQGAVEPIVEQRLAAHPTKWFLLALGGSLKPFVFAWRKRPQFAAQDSWTDEHAFMRAVFRYSAWARGAGTYGLWQLAWGSDGTT